MQKQLKTDSLRVEALDLPRCEDANISEWLSGLERAVEAGYDDNRREYTNIGGQDGLELFV